MKSIVRERVLVPRAGLDHETTFYSFRREGVTFEVSASDLLRALRPAAVAAGGGDDAEVLAAKLRSSIAASERVLREEEVPATAAMEANSALKAVFEAGGFRIAGGTEAGSSLMLGDFTYAISENGRTSAANGVIFFWSASRRPIFIIYDFVT
jgi:hypothetical protein